MICFILYSTSLRINTSIRVLSPIITFYEISNLQTKHWRQIEPDSTVPLTYCCSTKNMIHFHTRPEEEWALCTSGFSAQRKWSYFVHQQPHHPRPSSDIITKQDPSTSSTRHSKDVAILVHLLADWKKNFSLMKGFASSARYQETVRFVQIRQSPCFIIDWFDVLWMEGGDKLE